MHANGQKPKTGALRISILGGVLLFVAIAAFPSAGSGQDKPPELSFDTYSGELEGFGEVAIEIAWEDKVFKEARLWWLIDAVRVERTARVDGGTLYFSTKDGAHDPVPCIAFEMFARDQFRIKPYGVFKEPLDPLVKNLVLEYVASSGGSSAGFWSQKRRARSETWSHDGWLKAIPPEWPPALTGPTTLLFASNIQNLLAALKHPNLPPSTLHEIIETADNRWGEQAYLVQAAVAQQSNVSVEDLETLWTTITHPAVRIAVASNPSGKSIWTDQLVKSIIEGEVAGRVQAARIAGGPVELYLRLAHDTEDVRRTLAVNQSLPIEAQAELLTTTSPQIERSLAMNRGTDSSILISLAKNEDREVRNALIRNPRLPAAVRREVVAGLAASADMEQLGQLASDPDLPADALSRCMLDLTPTVRAAIARNPGASEKQLSELAQDESAIAARAAREELQKRFPAAYAELQSSLTELQSLDQSLSLTSRFEKAVERSDMAELQRLTDNLRQRRELDRAMEYTAPKVIKSYRPEIMDYFLANDFNKYRVALTDLAAKCDGNMQWLEYFKRHGAFEGRLGGRALGQSILTGSTENVGALIAIGVDVNAPLPQGNLTALHLAVARRNMPLVVLLVNAGADLNARDQRRQTPLDYAVLGKFIPAIRLLDKKHEHDDVLHAFAAEFPESTDPHFIGQWTNKKDGFETIVIRFDPDATGWMATVSHGGLLVWKKVSDTEVVAYLLDEKGEIYRDASLRFRLGEKPEQLLMTFLNGETQTMYRDPRATAGH